MAEEAEEASVSNRLMTFSKLSLAVATHSKTSSMTTSWEEDSEAIAKSSQIQANREETHSEVWEWASAVDSLTMMTALEWVASAAAVCSSRCRWAAVWAVWEAVEDSVHSRAPHSQAEVLHNQSQQRRK